MIINRIKNDYWFVVNPSNYVKLARICQIPVYLQLENFYLPQSLLKMLEIYALYLSFGGQSLCQGKKELQLPPQENNQFLSLQPKLFIPVINFLQLKDKDHGIKAWILEQTHIMIDKDFRNKATIVYIRLKFICCPFLKLESFYTSQKALQKIYTYT